MEEATGAPSSIGGLTSEAAAGFQSRRGLNHDDSAPVTPHNAPFPTYKAARVHHHALRRCGGGVAARGGGAATAKDAACRLCRYAAARRPTLCEFPQADGRTRLSGRPEFHIRLYPNTERRRLRKKLS